MIEKLIDGRIDAALQRQARSQRAMQEEQERRDYLEQRAREFFELMEGGKPIPWDFFYGTSAVAKAPEHPGNRP